MRSWPLNQDGTRRADDLEFDLNNIRGLNKLITKNDQPYTVDLKLDGKSLTMEIGTGACVSLISEQTFKHFSKKSLKPSKALSTYYMHRSLL